MFFENLENREICPVFKAFRVFETADLKPASVVIYDQFDKCKNNSNLFHQQKIQTQFLKSLKILFSHIARRALQFYRPMKLEKCDLCKQKECGELCPVNSRAQKQISNSSNRNSDPEVDKSQTKNSSNRKTAMYPIISFGLMFLLNFSASFFVINT